MSIRIGINGCGRIGRQVLRASYLRPELGVEVVAVNDLLPAPYLGYQLKYDSVHGRWKDEIAAEGNYLVLGSSKIRVFCEPEPSLIPWADCGVDYVVEATGRCLTADKAKAHLNAGARRVVITAHSRDDTPMFMLGVNAADYAGESIVSNASCTANALGVLLKPLEEHFGLEQGMMTAVHPLTAIQKTVDGLWPRDPRVGRACGNLIPSRSSVAKALGRMVPAWSGRLHCMAVRVPVMDVALVDLTCTLRRRGSYAEICAVLEEASQGRLQGLLGYTEESVVSADFINDTHSCIFDATAGLTLNDHLFKLCAWYDNETGYPNRVLDLIKLMNEQCPL